jgi:hypothetical protein
LCRGSSRFGREPLELISIRKMEKGKENKMRRPARNDSASGRGIFGLAVLLICVVVIGVIYTLGEIIH